MAVVLTISERLRNRLGDATDDLVGLLNQFGESNKEDVIQTSRESFEKTLAQTKGELMTAMAKLETRIEEKLGDVRAETGSVRAEMGNVRSEMGLMEGRLEAKIAQSQSSMIRWMFAFWIGQAAFVFGLLMVFVKR